MKIKISGVPYAKSKVRGRIEGCQEWTDAIIAQTRGREPAYGPFRLDVEFLVALRSFAFRPAAQLKVR